MWNNYELRQSAGLWKIVHIATGYVAETYKSRAKAEAMLARYNSHFS